MKTRIIATAITIFTTLSVFANPPAEEGRLIFTSRCAGCHNVNKILTGPALGGVDQRRSMDWIINFVHSSQSLIKSGDKDAIALFEKFNKIPMPDHKDLSADHIKNIVDYIKSETKAATDAAPFRKPGKLHPNYVPLSIYNYGYFLCFLGAVALLIGALLAFVNVKMLQRERDQARTQS
jgi:cytochrome c2